MPSHKSNHYGSEFEKFLAEQRGLVRDGVHTAWKDLEFGNGTPVEAKAAMASGSGYFQLYEQQHRVLLERGGWYGFGVYRPRGNSSDGIRVLRSKLVRAVDVPVRWVGGDPDRGRKCKLPISEVF